MKNLIVTADDFGLTEKINQGILEAHRRGIVTSASLMANGSAFDNAVARLKEAPRLGIGAHLNLTEGASLSRPSLVSSLVDRDGQMKTSPIALMKGIATGKVRLSEVELELRAQIDKVLAAGVKLTHLDGHKHIQLVPGVFEIVLKLAVENGIRGMRCATEPARGLSTLRQARRNGAAGLKQFALGRALSLFAQASRGKAQRAGLVTPSHFLGVTETGFLDTEQVSRILNNLPEGFSELMSHPGYVDEALKRTPTRLFDQRERELRAFVDPAVNDLIIQNGIQLITYAELNEAK